MPLVEIVHDGLLLCIVPRAWSSDIKKEAVERFIAELPFKLRFSTNNRLACEFVGGNVTWDSCRDLMRRTAKWNNFRNLFALPRNFASKHVDEIETLLEDAELKTSWIGLGEEAIGATVKPFGDHPGGGRECFPMDSVHALALLTITLNHKDKSGKNSAPNADIREGELLDQMGAYGQSPPEIYTELDRDPRARRVLLAMWVISKTWKLALRDENDAKKFIPKDFCRTRLSWTVVRGKFISKGDSRSSD